MEPDYFENDISGPAMDLSEYATLSENLLLNSSLEKNSQLYRLESYSQFVS
jgi:hypothetical protein